MSSAPEAPHVGRSRADVARPVASMNEPVAERGAPAATGARVAVVTGALGTLGRAIVAKMLAQGTNVVLADLPRVADEADSFIDTLRGPGRRVLFAPVDIRREAEVVALGETLVKAFGRLDILVNNAGINRDGLVRQASRRDWDEVLEVNLTGSFLCTAALFALLIASGAGRIVNVASIVGLRGVAGTPYYAAAKAGLNWPHQGHRQRACSLRRHGECRRARVHRLADDPRDLAQGVDRLRESILLKRLARPEEVASVVAFLASEDASYVTGAVVEVTGGFGA